jgi:hypothetical protein
MMRLTLLLGALAAAAPATPVALAPATHAAVVAAVRARMGADADVQVQALGAPVPPVAAVTDAVLEPGAAMGAVMRVALRAPVDRGGAQVLAPVAHVSVRVEVVVDHWHDPRGAARRPARRRRPHAGAASPDARGAASVARRRRGARSARRRDLAADACLTTRVVAPTPAVTAGAT